MVVRILGGFWVFVEIQGSGREGDRKLRIDLSRQMPGIYILRVMQDGELLEIKKVMVLK